jgi:hypothetical protein
VSVKTPSYLASEAMGAVLRIETGIKITLHVFLPLVNDKGISTMRFLLLPFLAILGHVGVCDDSYLPEGISQRSQPWRTGTHPFYRTEAPKLPLQVLFRSFIAQTRNKQRFVRVASNLWIFGGVDCDRLHVSDMDPQGGRDADPPRRT